MHFHSNKKRGLRRSPDPPVVVPSGPDIVPRMKPSKFKLSAYARKLPDYIKNFPHAPHDKDDAEDGVGPPFEAEIWQDSPPFTRSAVSQTAQPVTGINGECWRDSLPFSGNTDSTTVQASKAVTDVNGDSGHDSGKLVAATTQTKEDEPRLTGPEEWDNSPPYTGGVTARVQALQDAVHPKSFEYYKKHGKTSIGQPTTSATKDHEGDRANSSTCKGVETSGHSPQPKLEPHTAPVHDQKPGKLFVPTGLDYTYPRGTTVDEEGKPTFPGGMKFTGKGHALFGGRTGVMHSGPEARPSRPRPALRTHSSTTLVAESSTAGASRTGPGWRRQASAADNAPSESSEDPVEDELQRAGSAGGRRRRRRRSTYNHGITGPAEPNVNTNSAIGAFCARVSTPSSDAGIDVIAEHPSGAESAGFNVRTVRVSDLAKKRPFKGKGKAVPNCDLPRKPEDGPSSSRPSTPSSDGNADLIAESTSRGITKGSHSTASKVTGSKKEPSFRAKGKSVSRHDGREEAEPEPSRPRASSSSSSSSSFISAFFNSRKKKRSSSDATDYSVTDVSSNSEEANTETKLPSSPARATHSCSYSTADWIAESPLREKQKRIEAAGKNTAGSDTKTFFSKKFARRRSTKGKVKASVSPLVLDGSAAASKKTTRLDEPGFSEPASDTRPTSNSVLQNAFTTKEATGPSGSRATKSDTDLGTDSIAQSFIPGKKLGLENPESSDRASITRKSSSNTFATKAEPSTAGKNRTHSDANKLFDSAKSVVFAPTWEQKGTAQAQPMLSCSTPPPPTIRTKNRSGSDSSNASGSSMAKKVTFAYDLVGKARDHPGNVDSHATAIAEPSTPSQKKRSDSNSIPETPFTPKSILKHTASPQAQAGPSGVHAVTSNSSTIAAPSTSRIQEPAVAGTDSDSDSDDESGDSDDEREIAREIEALEEQQRELEKQRDALAQRMRHLSAREHHKKERQARAQLRKEAKQRKEREDRQLRARIRRGLKKLRGILDEVDHAARNRAEMWWLDADLACAVTSLKWTLGSIAVEFALRKGLRMLENYLENIPERLETFWENVPTYLARIPSETRHAIATTHIEWSNMGTAVLTEVKRMPIYWERVPAATRLALEAARYNWGLDKRHRTYLWKSRTIDSKLQLATCWVNCLGHGWRDFKLKMRSPKISKGSSCEFPGPRSTTPCMAVDF
ncbi:hypothetical protein FN846DRAFT_903926 [Sphaerosporella brunnea]|uniref:Uncharacterized protein n=1 Tax=Sphaerosporella brunnea TaxID=1250544 RepID=A0A5J5F620_9PEZI|nr:hypothetical protein FN846DRAFT_903926 [Sphaerosporella brunnea]